MFRWALLDLRTCYEANTLYLWALTDVPTHLILRWTDVVPRLSKTWPKRRGIAHEYRDRYITANWRATEQNEPGLTPQKTFTWPGWPPRVNYWFLFTHVYGAWKEASHSPLFTFMSPADPSWQYIYEENWTE